MFFHLCFLFFLKFFFFNLNILDLPIRTKLNEGFLSFYSFFWTNIWYLFIFVFFFALFMLTCYSSTAHVYILFSPCILVYLYEIQDLFNSNTQLLYTNCNFVSTNFFLLNNLNKYHPPILYASILFFFLITLFAIFIFLYSSLFFLKERYLYICEHVRFLLFCVNATALFLGSWWALQEGTWGGWWNWDSSEVFGLLFLLGAIKLMHSFYNFTIYYNYICFLLIYMLFLLFSYYLIQLNFDLISHNFGLRFFFFFNSNLFFLELLSFFSFYITLNISIFLSASTLFFLIYQKYHHFAQSEAPFSFKFVYTHFIIILSVVYFFFTFNSLFNYFFWTFAGASFANCEVNIYFYNFIFFSVFLLLFVNYKFNPPLLLSVFLLTPYPLIFMPFSPFTFHKTFFYMHSPILCFFALNLLNFKTDSSFYSIGSFLEYLPIPSYFAHSVFSTFTCDSFFFYLCYYFFLLDITYENAIQDISLFERYTGNEFFLYESFNNFYNLIRFTKFALCSTSVIELPSIIFLILITYVLMWIFLRYQLTQVFYYY